MINEIKKEFPQDFIDIPDQSVIQYLLVSREDDGKTFRANMAKIASDLDIVSLGGAPITFEGNQLPSVNNTDEPVSKGDWAMLSAGQTYTNIGEGTPLVAPVGRWSIAAFDGSVWLLKDMGALPVIETEDFVLKGGTRYTMLGIGVSKITGNPISSPSTNTTDFIKISSHLNFKVKGYEGESVAMVYFYDEFKQPISAYEGLSVGENTIILNSTNIPENARYLKSTESLSIEGDFEYYGNELFDDKIGTEDFNDLYKGLYSGYFSIEGRGINKLTGVDFVSTSTKITDFIKINGLSYRIKGFEGESVAMVYFYDKAKNPISALSLTPKQHSIILDNTNIPTGAYFFRSTASLNQDSEIKVIEGQKSMLRHAEEQVWNSKQFTVLGRGLDKTTGLDFASSSTRITPFIPFYKGYEAVVNGYEGSGVSLIWFYDGAKQPIGTIPLAVGVQNLLLNSDNTPEETRFIRSTGGNAVIHSIELIGIRDNFLYNNKVDKFELKVLEDLDSEEKEFSVLESTVDKNTGVIITASSVRRTNYVPLKGVYKAELTQVFQGGQASPVYFFTDTKRPISTITLPSGLNNVLLDKSNIPLDAAYFIATTTTAAFNNGVASVRVYGEEEKEVISNVSLASEYDALFRIANNRQSEMAVKMAVDGYTPKWYGFEWNEEHSNPDWGTPIGNDLTLHDTLPIQNKMRRCVVKDGNIQYFLDGDNSLLKEDGLTPSVLDGTDGDVMVEIPEFFFRVEEEGTLKRIKISEEAIPGYNYSSKRLTSAFESVIDKEKNGLNSNVLTNFTHSEIEIYIQSENTYVKSNSGGFSLGVQKTATIASYKPNASDFYGGDGTTTYNDVTDIANTNVSRNCLGRPSSNINRSIARQSAHNKGGGALMHLYDTHKSLWILSFVELKTRNYQKSFANGGLGHGATRFPNYDAANSFYGGMRAIIPTGVTLELGNNSGEVYYNMQNVPNSWPLGEWVDVWMPVNSYRGIENFYGHMYKSVDQINLREYTVSGEGNERIDNLTYFYQRNPFLTDDSFDRLTENIGSFTFKSYIKNITQLVLGADAHIVPKETGTNAYSTYYCDCCELKLATAGPTVQLKEIAFAGRYVSTVLCGPLFICSEGGERLDNPDYARASNVTRLDYILS